MRPIVIVAICISIIQGIMADQMVTIRNYTHAKHYPSKKNIIIVINEIEKEVNQQPILSKVLKKIPNGIIEESFQSTLRKLNKQNYQIILMSHLKLPNLDPLFSISHNIIPYEIRISRKRLNNERRIISNGFKLIDQFVSNERYWRP